MNEMLVPEMSDHAKIVDVVVIFLEIQDPLINVSVKTSGNVCISYRLNGFKYEMLGKMNDGVLTITSMNRKGDGDYLEFDIPSGALKPLLDIRGIYDKFISKLNGLLNKKMT
jgi:hypothetical protein